MKIWLSLFLLVSCRVSTTRLERHTFNSGERGEGPSLAVIGDSISTGVLSDTYFGQSLSLPYTTEVVRWLFAGFNPIAFQDQFSNLTKSFAATDEEWGLRGYIARKHGFAHAASVPVYMGAKFGGRLLNVSGMLQQLQDQYDQKGKVPEYVSFLVGANDFCESRGPDEFETQYTSVLGAVLQLHPESTVIVGFIPDVSSLARHQHRYGPFFSCRTTRQVFCPPLSKEENAGASRLQAFNAAIERL
jgi:lysophospholipase L1-like esterase